MAKFSAIRVQRFVGASCATVYVGGIIVYQCADVSEKAAEEEAIGWEATHVQRRWGSA